MVEKTYLNFSALNTALSTSFENDFLLRMSFLNFKALWKKLLHFTWVPGVLLVQPETITALFSFLWIFENFFQLLNENLSKGVNGSRRSLSLSSFWALLATTEAAPNLFSEVTVNTVSNWVAIEYFCAVRNSRMSYSRYIARCENVPFFVGVASTFFYSFKSVSFHFRVLVIVFWLLRISFGKSLEDSTTHFRAPSNYSHFRVYDRGRVFWLFLFNKLAKHLI